MFKFKSLEDVSLLRKFSVLFLLSSIFPIVILASLFYFLRSKNVMYINSHSLSMYLLAAALFALVGFIYMRNSLKNMNKISEKFQGDLEKNVPEELDIKVKGNNEVSSIVYSFNDLVQKVVNNIGELDKTKQLLLETLEREQTLSRTDYLTGIANRRVFYELLEMEINRFIRYKRPFTVILLDVDDFKKTNDTLGHLIGDAVLCTVANTIKENIRANDLVARIGGDEFAVLLAEVTVESPAVPLPRLQAKLREAMEKKGWSTTVSLGAVTYKIVPPSIDELIQKVDTLLYSAKHEGKNSIKHEIVNA